MSEPENTRPRGLAAVDESRKRRLEFPRIPPRYILWVLAALVVWAIIYWRIDQGKLESWRNRLLNNQRAVAGELSPKFDPVRDTLESWIIEAAGEYPGDLISEQARTSPFRSKPGVYLRLMIDDAKQVATIRSAAWDSLRDGFTSCFTTYPNPDPYDGPECKKNSECQQGMHCNEANHCTLPAQPFNMRVAYRASRFISEEWSNDVRNADSDMRLRLLERDFESAVKEDFPLAIDLIMRAKYFLLVLDENVANTGATIELPDAGSLSESLQAVHHPVRVSAWDIESKALLFRTRVDVGSAEFLKLTVDADSVDTSQIPSPAAGEESATSLAVRRQANNCAIASEVRRQIDRDTAN